MTKKGERKASFNGHPDNQAGDEKGHEKGESNSRTGDKQNAGHGGHK